ncbi:MipA/OmpV family protein [Oceaniglobus roseus]|uniref:MipA/OmpV family protein n=1 Tax=Oceaniglobus roseus TaxID=1737570 RepID=UPI000C7F4E61|nr:MipA/OmpV family protein [Kandeliimicrobium roseum]
MIRATRTLAILAATVACPALALAGGPTATAGAVPATQYAPPASSPDLIFSVRGGVAVNPEYFGSDDYAVGPDFSLGFGFLRLPGGRTFGSPDPFYEPSGFGLRGAFGYVGERNAADYPELTGLNTVDASVELGLGIGYQSRYFDAYADARYGVIGHHAWVGELGADVKAHPTDKLTLSIGPRLTLGSNKYASTYFGVSPAESAASGGALAAYDASGGVVSAGVELGAKYRINENWGVEGAVTYDRFTGDAADSPIVQQGTKDQYGVRIGLTRRITLDF